MLGEVAVLYRALGLLHITPIEADKMELWQVAVALGADEDYEPRSATQQDSILNERGEVDMSKVPRWEDLYPGRPDPIYGLVVPAN